MTTLTFDSDDTMDSRCTSHCVGQTGPACTGGGHCVANITAMWSRRPSRKDTLALLAKRARVTEHDAAQTVMRAGHCVPGHDTPCHTSCVAGVSRQSQAA